VRFAVSIAFVALLLAAGAHASTRSGLYGTVTRGPIAPVCAAEQACSEPAAGVVLVFLRNGTEAGRTTTAQNGTYRISLPASTYTVRASSRRPIDPASVTVRAGRFRHVDFALDTGIR
jgi:hypothetical protein